LTLVNINISISIIINTPRLYSRLYIIATLASFHYINKIYSTLSASVYPLLQYQPVR